MNTFAFVGDLEGSPEVSCVYHSEEAENQVGAAPAATPPPPAPHHALWVAEHAALPAASPGPPASPATSTTHTQTRNESEEAKGPLCLPVQTDY